MGAPEAAIVLLILLAFVGIPVLVGILLTRWAFRVARARATRSYQLLRWLPVAAIGLWFAGLAAGAAMSLARVNAVSRAEPEQKARYLGEAISETVNVGVLVSLVVMVCFIASAIASARGSRRPR